MTALVCAHVRQRTAAMNGDALRAVGQALLVMLAAHDTLAAALGDYGIDAERTMLPLERGTAKLMRAVETLPNP